MIILGDFILVEQLDLVDNTGNTTKNFNSIILNYSIKKSMPYFLQSQAGFK